MDQEYLTPSTMFTTLTANTKSQWASKRKPSSETLPPASSCHQRILIMRKALWTLRGPHTKMLSDSTTFS